MSHADAIAWAVNGVGSVIATVLAVILGMEIGFAGVALVAAGVYTLGTLSMISTLPTRLKRSGSR